MQSGDDATRAAALLAVRGSQHPCPPAESPSMPRGEGCGKPGGLEFHASILATLCLLLLGLKPISCLVTSQPGPAPAATHFLNLRLEPAVHRLTWESNVSGLQPVCRKEGPDRPVTVFANKGDCCSCSFFSLSLCHVTNYSVFPWGRSQEAVWIQFPESDPNRAAAARDLSCWVHHVVKMTCRWGRGQEAPSDVQYRMFWRDARLGQDQDYECQRYEVSAHGTHVGCGLDNITALPIHLTVTVRGSSREAAISCSDVSVDLQRVEILTPPNLTAECNRTEAHIHWDMRSRFPKHFEYELQINKSSDLETETEKTSDNYFRVVNPGTLFLRVRAKDEEADWSMWSQTKQLDCDPRKKHVTVTTVSLVALGVVIITVSVLLLCWRYSLMRKLFPPIPRLKDPMEDRAAPEELVMWATVPEDCEVMQVIESSEFNPSVNVQ